MEGSTAPHTATRNHLPTAGPTAGWHPTAAQQGRNPGGEARPALPCSALPRRPRPQRGVLCPPPAAGRHGPRPGVSSLPREGPSHRVVAPLRPLLQHHVEPRLQLAPREGLLELWGGHRQPAPPAGGGHRAALPRGCREREASPPGPGSGPATAAGDSPPSPRERNPPSRSRTRKGTRAAPCCCRRRFRPRACAARRRFR